MYLDIRIYFLVVCPYIITVLIEILAYIKQYRITYDQYQRKKLRFNIVQTVVNLIHSSCRLLYYAKVYSFLRSISILPYSFVPSVFLLIEMSVEKTLLNLAFNIYAHFYICPKTSPDTIVQPIGQFLKMKIRTWVYRAMVMIPLTIVILRLQLFLGQSLWWYAWGLILIESVAIRLFCLPSFLGHTPISSYYDSNLVRQIFTIADKFGFDRSRMYISSKLKPMSTFYQTGKYLVISEQALRQMSAQEIETLIYIELSRWKTNYYLKQYMMKLVCNGIWLYLLQFCIPRYVIYRRYGTMSTFVLGYVAMSYLLTPITFGYRLFDRWLARRSIYIADSSAVRAGYNVMTTLALMSSEKEHDNLYELVHCRKPSLNSRLTRISDKALKSA